MIMKIKNLIPLVPAALILGGAFFSHSCANTTTPPTGGPKDTIPPMLVNVTPLPGSTGVPVHGTKLKFKLFQLSVFFINIIIIIS